MKEHRVNCKKRIVEIDPETAFKRRCLQRFETIGHVDDNGHCNACQIVVPDDEVWEEEDFSFCCNFTGKTDEKGYSCHTYIKHGLSCHRHAAKDLTPAERLKNMHAALKLACEMLRSRGVKIEHYGSFYR